MTAAGSGVSVRARRPHRPWSPDLGDLVRRWALSRLAAPVGPVRILTRTRRPATLSPVVTSLSWLPERGISRSGVGRAERHCPAGHGGRGPRGDRPRSASDSRSTCPPRLPGAASAQWSGGSRLRPVRGSAACSVRDHQPGAPITRLPMMALSERRRSGSGVYQETKGPHGAVLGARRKGTTMLQGLGDSLVGLVALSLTMIAGPSAPASGNPQTPQDGYRNVALLRAVLHSSYATNNYNNTGQLTTDGYYIDPTAPVAPRPVVTASSANSTGPAAYGFDYHLNGQYWRSSGTLERVQPAVARHRPAGACRAQVLSRPAGLQRRPATPTARSRTIRPHGSSRAPMTARHGPPSTLGPT